LEEIVNGQLALITGASSGIGYSLALNLAQRGYDLVVASGGDRLTAALRTFAKPELPCVKFKRSRHPRGVEELAEVLESAGSLDVACINAGVGLAASFPKQMKRLKINMIELNCVGTVQLAKHVVRQMQSNGGGKILFTASIAGEMLPHEKLSTRRQSFRFVICLQSSGGTERRRNRCDRPCNLGRRIRLLPTARGWIIPPWARKAGRE